MPAPRTPAPQPTPPEPGGSGSSRRPSQERMFAGRFELLGELGRGGVGVVFRARDLRLGGVVALKVLRDPSVATVLIERMRREGKAAATLDHPGIVKLVASGELNGFPWLAFELVEGSQALTRAWRELDAPRRAAWVRDAARALGHAHARGLVHRDVKPSNLLVDALGRVRVTDFGIAMDESWERITRSGVLIGTPTHMAPEQIETRRGEVGPWSDVWALGVILYQGLTDELPFPGDSVLEIGRRVVEGRPRPPRELAPGVPAALEQACLACLRVKPDERPKDGEALAALLDRALAAGSKSRRHGSWTAPAALALLLLGAGGAGALVLVRQRTGETTGPVEPAPPPPARPSGPDVAALGSLSFQELQDLAQRGNGAAWTQLGRAHRAGTWAPPDRAEARRCFERAAGLDDRDGMLELALLLREDGNPGAALPWLERSSAAGSIAARVELARALRRGEGAPADAVRALTLLQDPAHQDDPEVLAALAEATQYAWGGGEPDLPRAAALWRRAAEGGSVAGMIGWGRALEHGRGVTRDAAAATGWFERAARTGNAEAKYEYALSLFNAPDSSTEEARAARQELEEAVRAPRPDPSALYVLGLFLVRGVGGPEDAARGRDCYRRAAELGHAKSMVNLGELLEQGGPAEAVEGRMWLRRAAEGGDKDGMHRYGMALITAQKEPRTPEGIEGVEWMRKAAAAGHPGAMTTLGIVLLSGFTVAPDPEGARGWLEKAAGTELGGSAAFDLARHLREGRHYPRDLVGARRWLERAVALESEKAMLELGRMLIAGEGGPADPARGRELIARAAEGPDGLPEARFELARLTAQGDPDRARAMIEEAAARGDPQAHMTLGGAAYEAGQFEAALHHWELAGEGGLSDGWMGVGLIHERGKGVPRDVRRAAEAYSQASALGNRDGDIMLAVLLHEGGPGLPAKPKEALGMMLAIAETSADPVAMRWAGVWLIDEAEPEVAAEGRKLLRMAATRDDRLAMETLAEALREGKGGPVDEADAARWEERAAQLRARPR